MNTKTLDATDPASIAGAVEILTEGGLIALPTETVYGLAADATNPDAVARIYEAKGRPSSNPLIVHVANLDQAKTYGMWTNQAEQLADAFWPGPLTMVLGARDANLAPAITAHQPSLALRVPAHPVVRAVITALGKPVAAPSANPSGRISPTTAAHVLQGLEGRIDAVLDAGPCEAGIESTIIAFDQLSNTPVVLRQGALSQERLQTVLGRAVINAGQHVSETPTAPGQLLSHYAPDALLRLNALASEPSEVMLGFGTVDGTENLSPSGDLDEAAANLFAALHRLDQLGVERIAVAPIPEQGVGRAINDRLRRAAAPRTR